MSHIPTVLWHRGTDLSLPALHWRTAQCWISPPGSGHSGWCSWPAWVVPTCDPPWTRWCPAQRWRVLVMAGGLLERRNVWSSHHLPVNRRGPGWEESRILCDQISKIFSQLKVRSVGSGYTTFLSPALPVKTYNIFNRKRHTTCFIKRNLHLLIYRLHVSYDQIMGFSQKVSWLWKCTSYFKKFYFMDASPDKRRGSRYKLPSPNNFA